MLFSSCAQPPNHRLSDNATDTNPHDHIDLHWSNDTLIANGHYEYLQCTTAVPLMVRGRVNARMVYNPNLCTDDMSTVVSILDSTVIQAVGNCHYLSLYLFIPQIGADYRRAPLKRLVFCEPDTVLQFYCVQSNVDLAYPAWPF